MILQFIPNADCINSMKMLAGKQKISELCLFSTISASENPISCGFFFFWSAQRPSLKSSNLFLKRDLGIQASPVNLEIMHRSFAASLLDNCASAIIPWLPEHTNLLPTFEHFPDSVPVFQGLRSNLHIAFSEMRFCKNLRGFFFFAFKLLLERMLQIFLPHKFPCKCNTFQTIVSLKLQNRWWRL